LNIEYLHRKDIDEGKWDAVISRSPVETLYPLSWYLDASAVHWSALVMDDYRFVMPLVWKQKAGIPYLYQPVFCQQLGVFGEEVPDPRVLGAFIDRLLKRYRFGVVQFNSANRVGEDPRFRVSDRINLVLSMDRSYGELSAAYSENARRNLKRALGGSGELRKDISLEELMAFKRAQDVHKKSGSVYGRMQAQLGSVLNHGKGEIYGIMEAGGELLAAAFMAFSKQRVIYLLSVSSESGKEQRAMFRIVDQVIRDYQGSGLTLDFEGSNIPSIARFFNGFGAQPETYQRISFNRFPVPIKARRNDGG
jgi:hypothetical protein